MCSLIFGQLSLYLLYTCYYMPLGNSVGDIFPHQAINEAILQDGHQISCGILRMITAIDPIFVGMFICKKKWNESGFRPPLCTYRLNWARRTSWGWWDDWDDTVLQTQDSKFEPWRSEAEHATSRSRRLPTILTFTRGWGRNNFVSFKPPRPGTEPRTLAWKAAVLTTTLGPPPVYM